MKSKKIEKNQCRGVQGFTLIEIMIVLAIVGLLFSFVGVKVIREYQKAKVQAAKIQIGNFEQALQAYYLDNNRYPHTSQGLDALIDKPTVGKEPKNYAEGGYLGKKTLPEDPWGNPYTYECDDYQNFVIGSLGKDGEEGTDDDLTSEE